MAERGKVFEVEFAWSVTWTIEARSMDAALHAAHEDYEAQRSAHDDAGPSLGINAWEQTKGSRPDVVAVGDVLHHPEDDEAMGALDVWTREEAEESEDALLARNYGLFDEGAT